MVRGGVVLATCVVLALSGCSDAGGGAAGGARVGAGPADAGTTDPAGPSSDATNPAAAKVPGGPGAGDAPGAVVVVKPAADPSPEQLARWGVAMVEPLRLLACYDGFSDETLLGMAITPDGKQLIVGGTRLTLWNPAEDTPSVDLLAGLTSEQVERPIMAVGVSEDGALLAAGDARGTLRVWRLGDRSELLALRAHNGRLTQLAFSPDSRMLATASPESGVRLWQLPDGTKGPTLKTDHRDIGAMVFVSEALLATAGRGGTQLWNVTTGKAETSLSSGNRFGAALGLSRDRKWLIFNDSKPTARYWDLEKGAATELTLAGAGVRRIEFSPDGKWIATEAGGSTIRIWDAATRRVVQVIDTYGSRVVGFKWIAETGTLAVASEGGRIRIWGTSRGAESLGIEPMAQPELRAVVSSARRSYAPAQFDRIIDLRSFPRLPDAIANVEDDGMESYTTAATQAEAELFYRYWLGQNGWGELAGADPAQPGLNFVKDGCRLNVGLSAEAEGTLQVRLQLNGNYDARWLPEISPSDSTSRFSSFSNVIYRSKKSLTDVEVAILKQFHEAGWTPYTRLAASSAEAPGSRSLSMVQGGSELTVLVSDPADSSGEVFVQTNVSVAPRGIPTPPDSGWIELDTSTDLMMVANTKLSLEEAVAFYDKEMALDGWIGREAGRKIDSAEEAKTNDSPERRGRLPYIRGGQEVLIRMASLPGGGTRIVVGDAERFSWQYEKAERADSSAAGIEAADFSLPKGAAGVRYDVDEGKIGFELTGVSAPQLAEQFIQQMESLKWERDGAGILTEEYSFVTYEKDDLEIQIRARGEKTKTTATISGDGLLWTKALPTAPVRISYETWLRRNRKPATLDLLDEFAEEMRKIPAQGGGGK